MKIKLITALIIAILLSITVGNTALAIKLNCSTCGCWQEATFLGYVYWDNRFHCEKILCNVCNNVTEWWQTPHEASIAATCTERAYCNICKSYFGKAAGHSWGAWISNGNGTHTRTCKNDSSHAETQGCSGGTATCVSKAYCDVCNSPYGNTDPNAHDVEHHKAKAATCLDIGWNEYNTCSRCSYTTYAELPALNHDLVPHAAKAPTCTEKGWNEYNTCSRCDHTTYAELPALNHDLVPHAAKAATCTEKGWNEYNTCSRCSYTTYAELPALNHDLVPHAAKAPTCLDIGWNEYDTCSRCDHTTYAELPALNHDLVHHDAKAASCLDIGWNEYDTCSRCDYATYYAELPALGHDYRDILVKPTCETDGYTLFACSRCNDSYTEKPTGSLGHWFGEWSPKGTGSHIARCLRRDCNHTRKTDCRKLKFQIAENESLTVCPVCGQTENGNRMEMIEGATAAAVTGKLPAGEVTARTNGDYLILTFEYAGKLTQPTGQVKITLPVELPEGRQLERIAPNGTQAELPYEINGGEISFVLDFTESEIPAMLIRLIPQTSSL